VHEEEDWPPEDDMDEILEDMFDQATHQGVGGASGGLDHAGGRELLNGL
jgi:hypothetical protein